MPLLLADFIYTRDCKLNLRKNVDTTRRVHRSTNPGFWAHLEQRRKEKAGERNLSPRLKGGSA